MRHKTRWGTRRNGRLGDIEQGQAEIPDSSECYTEHRWIQDLNRAEGRGGYSGGVDLKKKTKAKSKGKGQPFSAEKGPRGPDALGLGLPRTPENSPRG